MAIFNSYVELPEGNQYTHNIWPYNPIDIIPYNYKNTHKIEYTGIYWVLYDTVPPF